jgi:hypothetical protein
MRKQNNCNVHHTCVHTVWSLNIAYGPLNAGACTSGAYFVPSHMSSYEDPRALQQLPTAGHTVTSQLTVQSQSGVEAQCSWFPAVAW